MGFNSDDRFPTNRLVDLVVFGLSRDLCVMNDSSFVVNCLLMPSSLAHTRHENNITKLCA